MLPWKKADKISQQETNCSACNPSRDTFKPWMCDKDPVGFGREGPDWGQVKCNYEASDFSNSAQPAFSWHLCNALSTGHVETDDKMVLFPRSSQSMGTSLAVQWLELRASMQGGQVQSLVGELRSRMWHSTAKK